MTTNVYDVKAQIMTSDSRWSIKGSNFILYADDTGFDKLLKFDANGVKFTAMFAGSSLLINYWKDWFKTEFSIWHAKTLHGVFDPLPPVQHLNYTIAMYLINASENNPVWGTGFNDLLSNQEEAVFAGSGSLGAHGCWKNNRCAKKAVETAKVMDVLTGGEIKYIDFREMTCNVDLTTGFDVLKPSFLHRGMIMYTTASKGTTLPITEAAANDPEVQKLMDDIANGSVVANAPYDGMYRPWTEEDKEGLKIALAKAFNPK